MVYEDTKKVHFTMHEGLFIGVSTLIIRGEHVLIECGDNYLGLNSYGF